MSRCNLGGLSFSCTALTRDDEGLVLMLAHLNASDNQTGKLWTREEVTTTGYPYFSKALVPGTQHLRWRRDAEARHRCASRGIWRTDLDCTT